MKICKICKISKPEDLFRNNSSGRKGTRTLCKPCEQELKKTPEGKQKSKYYKIKDRYGLTKDQYDWLIENYKHCMICGKPFEDTTPHVDHNHITGKFRGLLCPNHNKALGLFNDDITLLFNAIKYLIISNTEPSTTIPQGSTLKRVEAHSSLNKDEDIV